MQNEDLNCARRSGLLLCRYAGPRFFPMTYHSIEDEVPAANQRMVRQPETTLPDANALLLLRRPRHAPCGESGSAALGGIGALLATAFPCHSALRVTGAHRVRGVVPRRRRLSAEFPGYLHRLLRRQRQDDRRHLVRFPDSSPVLR
jgi:hypothetical protein